MACLGNVAQESLDIENRKEVSEGKHERWLCRDMPNNITGGANPLSKLLAHSVMQDPTSDLHQVSGFTPSKRQRKNCKPLRVPPAYENSQLPAVLESGSKCLIQRQDQLKLGCLGTPIVSEEQQHHGLTQQSVVDIIGVGIDGMRRLKPSAPSSMANSSHMHKPQPNYSLEQEKLSNRTANSGSGSFTHLLTLQQIDESLDPAGSTMCRNVDCQARISPEASFCRRCSCCICKLFDENKDASLWISCDPKSGGCGLSCHIECALKQHVAGVVKAMDGFLPCLDGSYFCLSCRATTPMIKCWKGQLLMAKHAQTVDVLRYRLHLSCKMLKGTKLHKNALAPVEEAVKRLDGEIAQTAAGSAKLAQLCVNRLLCNLELQKLMSLALERAGVDAIDNHKQAVCEAQHTTRGLEHVELQKNGYASLDMVLVNAEECSRRCINQAFEWQHSVGGCRNGLKIQDPDEVFPGQQEQQAHSTSSLSPGVQLPPKHKVRSMVLSIQEQRDNAELKSPSSPYKRTGAMPHHERRPGACANPPDVHVDPFQLRGANIGTANLNTRTSLLECEVERMSRQMHPCGNKQEFLMDTVDYHYSTSLDALCSKAEKVSTKVLQSDGSEMWVMQVQSNDQPSLGNTKADMDIMQGVNSAHTTVGAISSTSEADFNNYVFSVKVIRWLECQGHLKEEFRMKFLTWYTLSATEHEKRVVSIFIDTLQDEPESLAGQLVDAFEEIIGAKRQPITADSYCRRLW